MKHFLYSTLFLLCLGAMAQKSSIDSLFNALNDKSSDDSVRFYSAHKLAWKYLNRDPDSSVKYAAIEMSVAQKAGKKDWEARANNTYGVIAKNKGEFQEAMRHFRKCLELDKGIGNVKGMAGDHNNIGLIYKSLGDFSRAAGSYREACKLYESIHNQKGVSMAYNNMGVIYDKMLDLEKAKEYYERSLQSSLLEKDDEGIADSYNNLGIVMKKLGKFEESIKYHLESATLYEKLGSKRGMSMAYANLGVVYTKQNRLDEALELYQKALKIDKEREDKKGIGGGLSAIGEIYGKKGDHKRSLQMQLEGLKYARACHNLWLEKDIEFQVYSDYKSLGKNTEALLHFENYQSLKDSVAGEELQKEIIKKQMLFDFERKEASERAEQEKKDLIVQMELKQKDRERNYYLGGILLVGILALISFNAYRQKLKANKTISAQKREVEDQKQKIEEHRREILDSIIYAKRIQTSLLPTDKYITRILS